jgi:bacterioferritin-associated ferredoxin
MYVCICNAVTDREIRQCAALGVRSLDDLRESIGVASCCGQCAPVAASILNEGARPARDCVLQAA